MSAITSMPRVVRIPAELIRAMNRNAPMACEVFGPLVSGQPALAQIAAHGATSSLARDLAGLRSDFLRLKSDALAAINNSVPLVGPSEVALASVVALAGAGYVLGEASWEKPLRAIRTAATVEGAERASADLVRLVEAAHRATIEKTLAGACAKASAACGFRTSERSRGADGSLRVVSIDGTGKALVSEIHVPDRGTPALATEVLGVADGSCQRILDRFDAAMAEQGLAAERVERHETRGRPGLAAAREFIRRAPFARRQIPTFTAFSGCEEDDDVRQDDRSEERQRGR